MTINQLNYKALVCITSCNRLDEVKKYIWDYISFCNKNEGFDFLLALDGNSEDYIDFCNEFKIPLLYSDEREGVGLSKNRVLKQFPDYGYYFFIEDDVELLDDNIFALHISIAKKTGYHHLSVAPYKNVLLTDYNYDGVKIIHAEHGAAQFNFFTRFGIDQIGGWHPVFAKHKRNGHVEHTLRFYNAGLSPAPFLIIKEALDMIMIHDPEHVTQPIGTYNNSVFIKDEWDLVQQKLKFFPIRTLSQYYVNEHDMHFNKKVACFLNKNKHRYPISSYKQRMTALSEFFLLKTKKEKIPLRRKYYFLLFIVYNPFSKRVKEFLLNRLSLYKKRLFFKLK